MKKHDLSYARHDPAHCLAPNLFRSLKRGERKKFKLDVTYHFGKNESMRFVGTELLGADDMRLLQGIVALGGPNGLLLTPEPTTEIGQQLRMFLDLDFEAIKQDGLIVCRGLSKLLTEVGMTDSGDNIKALKASLLRMSNTTILVTKGQQKAAFHLMSHAVNEADSKLWIALNPRIAGAILGRRPYTHIVMAEVRSLQTDPARLMHQRLCGWINPGKSGCIVLDNLCRYIWHDEATNPNTMKTRHRVARKALSELVSVGWTVTESVKDKWEIKRPAQPS